MSTPSGSVSVVTQTCVRPESTELFKRWQDETSEVVARLPGFIEQKVMPPNPPTQVDWAIVQRFATLEAARNWLHSPERERRIAMVEPLLIGRDDVHIVADNETGVRPAPVSVVISTRVRPGMELAYRAWERRIAAEQTRAAGFQGYRFEPPVPGVQDDFLAILRFDSEANLQAWLESPARKRLVEEAAPMTEEFHTRLVRTGFDHWFGASGAATGGGPAPWKMNMIVVVLLYPIVFLFGYYVQTPYLSRALGLPFSMALFCANVVSTVLLAFLVPVVANRMGWWLTPAPGANGRIAVAGAALIGTLYAAMIAVFTMFF
jgi:uncharacterized protein